MPLQPPRGCELRRRRLVLALGLPQQLARRRSGRRPAAGSGSRERRLGSWQALPQPSWLLPSWLRLLRGRRSPAGCAGKTSFNLRTTGGSTVDDADRTNSPMSWSLARTTLLSTPSSLASSYTRTLATALLFFGPGLVARTVSTSTCSLLRAHRVLFAISSCFRSVSATWYDHGSSGDCCHRSRSGHGNRADIEARREPQGPWTAPVVVRRAPDTSGRGAGTHLARAAGGLRSSKATHSSSFPPLRPATTRTIRPGAPACRHPTHVRRDRIDADGAVSHGALYPVSRRTRRSAAPRRRARRPPAPAAAALGDRRCPRRCRSATRSAAPPAWRFAPHGRWPATAGSRGRPPAQTCASASTTVTDETRAGESACPTNSAGSADQSTMSIFSPCSSAITARTRAPIGPMHAPLALDPVACEWTAILVRWPASRAMATISTEPSAISGTSRANNFLTSHGASATP